MILNGKARQFMDLGQAGIAEKDEVSIQSSSEETRSRDFSIVESMASQKIKSNNVNNTNNEIVAIDLEKSDSDHLHQRIVGRELENSQAQSTQVAGILSGSNNNKVPRFNSSRDVEQASQTMSMIRKARVSVRARSDAAMVCMCINSIMNVGSDRNFQFKSS